MLRRRIRRGKLLEEGLVSETMKERCMNDDLEVVMLPTSPVASAWEIQAPGLATACVRGLMVPQPEAYPLLWRQEGPFWNTRQEYFLFYFPSPAFMTSPLRRPNSCNNLTRRQCRGAIVCSRELALAELAPRNGMACEYLVAARWGMCV